MSADWKEYKLTDLYEISSGLSKPASAFGSGFPFLSFKEVFNNYFLPDELDQLVESSEKERQKGTIKRGDVFLTRTSETMHELGMSSVALKDYKEATFNGFSKKLRPKPETASLLHPEFIGYSLRSPSFRTSMLAFSTMSTRASLNNEMIGRLTITLPDINDQIRIARILKSLDDKAAINKEINQTLEQIAQAIFKSWFVDFEPVKAKIAAREAIIAEYQEQSGKAPSPQEVAEVETQAAIVAIAGAGDIIPTEQLHTLADLFPNQFVESELGEIPEGWEASNIGSHFDVTMGQSPKGDTYNENGEGIVFFQGRRDFGFRFPSPRIYTTDPKRFADAGDTLISVRAPVGDKNMASVRCCLGRGVAAISHKLKKVSFTYAFISNIEDKLGDSGSDGTVFSSINKTELNNVPFIVPSHELIDQFERLVSPMDNQVEVNSNQITGLENLRDTLLPKLLSGEVNLKDKEVINA